MYPQSVGIKVTFGNFTYFSGGDINGIWQGAANNVETVAGPRVGSVDVFRANNMGAPTANNEAFVELLQPQVTVLNCGLQGSGNNPGQEVLDRLLGASDVFMFHYCSDEREYGDAIVVTQAEIHIVSEDGGGTFGVHDEDRYYQYIAGATPAPGPEPSPPPPPIEWVCAATMPPCNTCEPVSVSLFVDPLCQACSIPVCARTHLTLTLNLLQCCRDYLPGTSCDACVQVECVSKTI